MRLTASRSSLLDAEVQTQRSHAQCQQQDEARSVSAGGGVDEAHAGLRVYDISDSYVPKKIAYFIPPNPEKLAFDVKMANKPLGTAEDLVVDDRGIIYLNAMHDGVYILMSLV